MAPEQDASKCSEEALSAKSWKLLWFNQEKSHYQKRQEPCYGRIEHWGGWKDCKRAGKVSVKTL